MTWSGMRNASLGVIGDLYGENVIYQGPDMSVVSEGLGVFDAAHELVTMGPADLPVSSVGPVLSVRVEDWPVSPVAGGKFLIGGVGYIVRDVMPDSDGLGTDYILHRETYGI